MPVLQFCGHEKKVKQLNFRLIKTKKRSFLLLIIFYIIFILIISTNNRFNIFDFLSEFQPTKKGIS